MVTQTETYDLLLKGGHVIDPANGIDGPTDVAISGGKIAAVQPDIPRAQAKKVVDVSGKYLTPGLVDIHVHVYGYMGWVFPDSICLPNCTTTVVDAGGAGWRNFEHFRNSVIRPTDDRVTLTRVLAFLNIVGAGMLGWVEQKVDDMDPVPAAEMVARYPDLIVGIKTAHHVGPYWEAVDGAAEAARLCGKPAMYDVTPLPTRRFGEMVLNRMNPGDILTHCYNPKYWVVDEDYRVTEAAKKARERGIIFDVGHGAGSFYFRVAVPCIEQGFPPDCISTDLHRASSLMPNARMLPTMSKFLNMGLSLSKVIELSTAAPARLINRPELGTLSVGAEADVAVLTLEKGDFGFVDSGGALLRGTKRLHGEVTIRAGQVVWDLNGTTCSEWHENLNYGRPSATRDVA